jgi:hypothetical protein
MLSALETVNGALLFGISRHHYLAAELISLTRL